MTTITAVNSVEIEIRNNGRVIRVPVLSLLNVDEQVASCTRVAVQYVGQPVNVPSKQPRGCKPRNYAFAGVSQ
jgi:hypothetical protein